MRLSTRRSFLAFAAATPLGLAACGPNEQAQAAALQRFLQTRVLDRQGLAVPRPTPEERASFGRFAADYDVILAFHDRMNDQVSTKLSDVIRRGSFNRAQDFIERKGDIATARDGLRAMATALEGALKDAQAARAGLNQPEPLKTTYGQAFERSVVAPAEVFGSVMPAADGIFTQGLAFSDFLSANRAGFKFNGPVVEASRADLLQEFNKHAEGLRASGEGLLAAQRRLQSMLRGQ
jgi:hypothetical protein